MFHEIQKTQAPFGIPCVCVVGLSGSVVMYSNWEKDNGPINFSSEQQWCVCFEKHIGPSAVTSKRFVHLRPCSGCQPQSDF